MTIAIRPISQRSAILKNIKSGIDFILPNLSPVKKKRSDNSLIRKVTVFARQLMRHNKDMDIGQCMWYAWDEMKKFPENYRLVKFIKIDKKTGKETICQRVISSSNWSDHYSVKGTGTPLAKERVLFVDAARLHSGINGSISTYTDRIIELF